MRQIKVRVNRSQLDYFRTLARESKNEIFAFLVGESSGPAHTVVEFVYPVLRHHSPSCVDPLPASETAIKFTVHAKGLAIIGTIHSHPNYWPVLSPTDYEDHLASGHKLSAVCSVYGRKTTVFFWVSDSSLPCKVIYA